MERDYCQEILNQLLDQYERRGLYQADSDKKPRPISLNIPKVFPEYGDSFGDAEQGIAVAIERLVQRGILQGQRDARGYYGKIVLLPEHAAKGFDLLGRVPVANVRGMQTALLKKMQGGTDGMVHAFCTDQLARLSCHKPIDFGIGDDFCKLGRVLLALQALLRLEQETYLRNFSEAVFHDSKLFQKIQGPIERILMCYSTELTEQQTVLEQYNLFENPAYIMVKGQLKLHYGNREIDVSVVPDGLAVPSASLKEISRVEVLADTLVSVENLTTYHDVSQERRVVLYLGGFHNAARTYLLQKIFQDNTNVNYYHKGDLDPYGFLILENLKRKTGIPFHPLEMDMDTLKRCYEAGHYRPLDAADEKAMTSALLAPYSDIMQFMRLHHCKIEQECFEAMKLGIN